MVFIRRKMVIVVIKFDLRFCNNADAGVIQW